MTTAVAMALYNGEKFLEEQLESLRLQTTPPDQVVLCDDGSKDNTRQIVRNYIERHGLGDQWSLIINEKNLGYIRNFYSALEKCTADIVFLADQDDLWRLDKIEKMTAVMEKNPNIAVLSCRHGVVDAEGAQLSGVLVPNEQETLTLECVQMESIMRSYRWPGMCLALRRTYLQWLLPQIDDCKIPHDVVLAICAADRDAFWEFGYIGADHRRHTNNTGKEEHRISKVLNLERKLMEVRSYNDMLERLAGGNLPLAEKTRQVVQQRLALSVTRKNALEKRKLGMLLAAYPIKKRNMLRIQSLICDLYLLCAGDYRALKK